MPRLSRNEKRKKMRARGAGTGFYMLSSLPQKLLEPLSEVQDYEEFPDIDTIILDAAEKAGGCAGDVCNLTDELNAIQERFRRLEDYAGEGDKQDVGAGELDDGKAERGGAEVLGKKELKTKARPTIALLKTNAVRPDVVESCDVTAQEAGLLTALKSWPRAVQVPNHWSRKSRYLAHRKSRRGEYQLPPNIALTKIKEIRAALTASDRDQTGKQKMRARLRPKVRRMDLDYQVCYDAFFIHPFIPKLTEHGELYYEGREYETKYAHYKPGYLSDELREALGIVSNTQPPPWLHAMQRYGPPPAYPGLRVPGVNCPLPLGAQYGYGPNGWGATPFDQEGQPLWGDLGPPPYIEEEENRERILWGRITEFKDKGEVQMDVPDSGSDSSG